MCEQTRPQRDQEEAACLLEQQRAMLGNRARRRPPLPAELMAHYRELLRTYVIMGSGNLADELRRLAELLVAAGLTARQTLQLHLDVLEELVHGLGTRAPGT